METLAALIVWIVVAVTPFGPARIEVELPGPGQDQPRIVRSVGVVIPDAACTRSAYPTCRRFEWPAFPAP